MQFFSLPLCISCVLLTFLHNSASNTSLSLFLSILPAFHSFLITSLTPLFPRCAPAFSPSSLIPDSPDSQYPASTVGLLQKDFLPFTNSPSPWAQANKPS